MEPIAIIGMGCRFPQADSPEAFWQLLKNGKQAIRSVPAERWAVDSFYDPTPGAVGKMNSCRGGFLDDIDQFDADFFGIDKAEAQHIDPQQRLFLEVAWEALEHAGVPPLSLGGSATGVFTGLCTIDYHRLLYRDFECIGPHSGTGTTMSITANRLSYLLDLRGPSMAVDAACSSALVALHLACQSLRTQESNLCVAGGVNLILSPDSMISSAQTGLLSMQGQCRPFDAAADGYVRGEGCGAVILKRLSDAVAAGDRVLAVIRGSAINQDGLSNSMTAPNGLAQQSLIQQSLKNSGVEPKDIDYVEAHAVGTPLGDAIELKALKKVLAAGSEKGNSEKGREQANREQGREKRNREQGREKRNRETRNRKKACMVGSVKANIGHLEAASGMAALIKVVLALQHEEIPPQLNFEQAGAYVDLEAGLFEIATASKRWARHFRPRLAGVSTFGFGGTNAHFVIGDVPVSSMAAVGKADRLEPATHQILTLTAKSQTALRKQAQRYSDFLLSCGSCEKVSLSDVCFTANTGRSHFAQRLCVVSHSLIGLQQQLAQFADGEETLLASRFITGKAKGRKRPKVAFYFPEPNADTLLLGEQLYKTQSVFKDAFDRCAQRMGEPLSFSIRAGSARISGLAVGYVIAALWKSWGVQPKLIIGEGLCEYEMPLADARPTVLSSSDLVLSMGVLSMGAETLSEAEKTLLFNDAQLMAVQGGVDAWPQLLTQLGELFVKGVSIDWAAVDADRARQKLALPTYPFERSRYWFAPAAAKSSLPKAKSYAPSRASASMRSQMASQMAHHN